MGYTTTFEGSLKISKPVEPWFKDYINRFSSVRHMDRDITKLMLHYPNWESLCYKGKLGPDGAFFIGCNSGTDFNDPSIKDINFPKATPGLWCDWIIDNNELKWAGTEKFYNYTSWLKFLITHFFEPEGYKLNGDIYWSGEDPSDLGLIKVKDNIVTVLEAVITYE